MAVTPTSFTGPSVPGVPEGFVRRDRLAAAVESGVGRGMVVVSAPAGAGKTLMLASWAAGRRRSPCWLSVDPADADPGRFWARVLSSLRADPDVPADSALAALTAPARFDLGFVGRLLQACEELPEDRVLVLDDLSLLTGTPAMASLAWMVRHGLGRLHLVLATRADPAIPLQRLRLAGELTEIRAAELAFGSGEAADLFARHGVHLRPEQLATVLARTEGWAAGLRLAALSLQSRADVEEAVEQLAGEQRTVADYFVEEVLTHLTPELTGFLLDTCVVHRVSADLANALTGRDDGQRTLALLERENLFVVALDDRRLWYRYHHLFGDLLRHRLAGETPDRRPELHRRAAAWFAGQGQPLEAARHLAEASDWQALARLVLRTVGPHVLGADREELVALVRRAPAEAVGEVPEIAAVAALACYAEYDASGVHAHVTLARHLLGGGPGRDAEITRAVLTTVEALAGWIDNDATMPVREAGRALGLLERITAEEMPAVSAYRLAATAVLAMGKLWDGRLDEAGELLTAAGAGLEYAAADIPVLVVQMHGSLAVLRALRGRLREASDAAGASMRAAEASGWPFLPQSAMAFLAEAIVHLDRAEPERCSVAIERGRTCSGDGGDRFTETGLTLVRASLELSAGNVAAARSALRGLHQRAAGWQVPPLLEGWRAFVEAEVVLAEGLPAAARRLSLLLHGPAGRVPAVHRTVLAARAALAANRLQECLAMLMPMRESPPADLVAATEVWLLSALAHDRLRHDAEALAGLGRALELAEPEGAARPFVLAGTRVRLLLERYQQTHLSHGLFVSGLLEKLGADEADHSVPRLLEPLTNRERSVLVLLPTMMSNVEIAGELFVSVNTVKVHLKSLYRKLGVNNRRQAVVRARELGLMSASEASVPA